MPPSSNHRNLIAKIMEFNLISNNEILFVCIDKKEKALYEYMSKIEFDSCFVNKIIKYNPNLNFKHSIITNDDKK